MKFYAECSFAALAPLRFLSSKALFAVYPSRHDIVHFYQRDYYTDINLSIDCLERVRRFIRNLGALYHNITYTDDMFQILYKYLPILFHNNFLYIPYYPLLALMFHISRV